MSYKQAKSAVPWKEGGELPEDVIRRIRGHFSALEDDMRTPEERLASVEAELNIAVDHATEHAMWRYHLEDKLAKTEAVLATRDEQLAEITEVVRFVREEWFERYYPSDIFTGVSGDEGVLDVIEIKKRLDLALSSAPAVGRHPMGETKKMGKKLIVSTGPAREQDFATAPAGGAGEETG